MVGVELLVGYLIAWSVRKARRAGERLDKEADLVLDSALDQLHSLVTSKLGADPAVARLEHEALATGEITERTRRRVADALSEAADGDQEFAYMLKAVLSDLQAVSPASAVVAGGDIGIAVGGDVTVKAENGGVAALRTGDVTIGDPHVDPSGPGRSRG